MWLGYVSRTNFPRLMALYANRPSGQMLRVLAHNMGRMGTAICRPAPTASR
jgi:hypothetical protein